jgi:hypothetical protein
MSDYSSFRPFLHTIRTRCRMYRQTPAYSSFYPTHRKIGSRHAARVSAQPLQFGSLGLTTDDHTVRRRVRIELSPAHRPGQILHSGLAIQPQVRAQLGECDALDLAPGPRNAA